MNSRKSKLTITKKIMLILFFTNTILGIAAGVLVGYVTQSVTIAQYQKDFAKICQIAAYVPFEEDIKAVMKNGRKDEAYHRIEFGVKYLMSMSDTFDGVYLFYPDEDEPYSIYSYNRANDEMDIGQDVIEYDEVDKLYILPYIRKSMEMKIPHREVMEGKVSSENIKFSITDNGKKGYMEIIGNDAGVFFFDIDNNGMYDITSWGVIRDEEGNFLAVFEMVALDAVMDTKHNVFITIIPMVLLFWVIGFVNTYFIRFFVTRRVVELNRYVNSYSAGSFKDTCPVTKGNDEVATLAVSFQEMAKRVEEYIIEHDKMVTERERVNSEMEVAARIQSSMLNSDFSQFDGRNRISIYASMTPAAEVGGDFYDFFWQDDTHFAVVVADVSGSNVSGAMFMMRSMLNIKLTALNGGAPSDILARVNNDLCQNNAEQMFVTVWLGILDITTGIMKCTNAGHVNPIIKKAKAEGAHYEIINDEHCFVLAGMEDMEYSDYEIQLENGDMIFLYSDGLTESVNEKEELYGEERLIATLNGYTGDQVAEVINTVKKSVENYYGEIQQVDDLTMLCFRYE